MKIVFITHYFPPEGNAPASRTFEHCRRWVANGNEVIVITGVPNVPDGIIYEGYRNKFFQWEEMEGIKVLRVWTYIAPNKGFLRRTMNYVSFMITSFVLGAWFIKKSDLVIATSPQILCGVSGYLFARIKKIKFCIEIRDLWPATITAVDAIKSKSLIRWLEKLELFLYKKADTIIVVTDSFKEIISKKGIDENKIKIIKNGVDLNFYKQKPKDKDLLIKYGLEGKFIVSYIGTIGMTHSLDKVLNVAEMLKDNQKIVFLLVGSGAAVEKLKKEKQKLSLSNVIFTNRQPKELMPAFYSVSDVCLVTLAKNELFNTVLPSKIFEIMAMGKPILLSVEGEVKALIDKAQSGLSAKPENINEIKEAILKMFDRSSLRAQMGENGRKFVEKYFDRDKLADELLKEIII